MKVIDLLNKIANNEEVPKKIKHSGTIYLFDTDINWYADEEGYYCLDTDHRYIDDIIEIIEEKEKEEKKIPEKIEYHDDSIAWVIDDVGQLSDVDKVIIDTLNNLIDYLKSKGE